MNESLKKKQIVKISVFITSIFIILISVTYAFITQVLIGQKQMVINAGVLDLVLEEENAITISDALTLYNESDFKIKRKIDVGISNDYSVAKLTV